MANKNKLDYGVIYTNMRKLNQEANLVVLNQKIMKHILITKEPWHESMCDQQRIRSPCAYAQPDQSLW